MGGAKKRSLSQIEKQQRLQDQKSSQQGKSSKTKTFERSFGGIELPSVSDKDLSCELAKMRAITPYALAVKYNIKLSIAKDWLGVLEKRGMLQRIVGSSSLQVYKFSGKA